MTKTQLLRMARDLGLSIGPEMTCDMLSAVIGRHHATPDTLPQVPVMLAKSFADLPESHQGAILRSRLWVAEEKLDGVRQRLHVGRFGNRLDSRRRSDKTCLFVESTDNFPHLRDCGMPGFEGTILDGELIAGSLPATAAMVKALPGKSLELQASNGKPRYVVFDLIVYRGDVLEGVRFKRRRELLELIFAKHVARLRAANVELVSQSTDARALLARVAASGGEGVMLKDTRHGYEPGRRVDHMLKWKLSQTLEVVITGSRPAEAGKGFDGLIGALEVSIADPESGNLVSVGAVQPASLAAREDMTAADGSLRREYFGRVVKVRHMGWTTNGRLRHCVLAAGADLHTPQAPASPTQGPRGRPPGHEPL